jgi:hypothetical protein
MLIFEWLNAIWFGCISVGKNLEIGIQDARQKRFFLLCSLGF